MQRYAFTVAVFLGATSANAQAIECQTVLECAQVAADTAAVMQQVVGELEARIATLEGQVSQLQADLAAEEQARATAVQAVDGKFGAYIPYGASVNLRSREGYLLSNNGQNQDEKDLLISGGKNANTAWTLEK